MRCYPIFINNLYVNLDYLGGDIDVMYTYSLYWCRLNSRLTRFPTDLQQLYIDEVAQGIRKIEFHFTMYIYLENTDNESDETWDDERPSVECDQNLYSFSVTKNGNNICYGNRHNITRTPYVFDKFYSSLHNDTISKCSKGFNSYNLGVYNNLHIFVCLFSSKEPRNFENPILKKPPYYF